MNITVSSLKFPPHLQLQLALLLSNSVGLLGKFETFGGQCILPSLSNVFAFNCSQVSKSPLKSKSLKHSGLLSHPTADTREAWGDSVKQYTSSISFQSCLQSHNCTSLLIQGCRDSSCGLGSHKPPNQALNHIRPLGLKHVSAEMAVDLASGGSRLRGEDTAVASDVVK